jgi:hypothetical protein
MRYFATVCHNDRKLLRVLCTGLVRQIYLKGFVVELL